MKDIRVESGIPGMDELIEGGYVRNSVNLVAGQTGTGKTIFCMQYLLHGLRKGESAIYITLEQNVDDIIGDLDRFGWGTEIKKYIDSGKLIIHYLFASEIQDIRDNIIDFAEKIKAKRMVLDSLTIAALGWKEGSRDTGKVRREVMDFISAIKKLRMTSILIVEIPEDDSKALSKFGFEEFIVDSVIILHYLEFAAGGTPRSLLVRKMRRTDHGTDIYPMLIGKNGIKVEKIE